ncbi:polygalacturonase-1 non-catalytic subunit beta-like isoform X3 [Panicum hallii]|uniref:polygalacturonase-1 non-catalytic subunit beta-like isoform X3 n=1 Tax=Panicum hallii TaxID=206008 RepID=UPI000DF4D1E6|nr:polygalacturonase-1 non-catalytic subunit beta-like isoform X3 [Panicum hallii]
MHKHNMDAIAPLVILLLVSGAAGASKHADRSAAAAVTSSSRTMAPMEYWRAVLPLTPIPRAIHDLLTHSTVHVSQDSKGVAQGKNTDAMENHQSQGEGFVKGPQKIGKGNEVEMKMQFSGAQFKEDENVLMLKGMNNHFNFYGTNAKEDLKKISTSYTSQIQKAPRKTTESYGYQGNKGGLRKGTLSYRSQGEDLRTISTSYGSQGEDLRTVSTSYGSQGEDLRTVSISYGSQDGDLRTVSASYGSQGDDLRTVSTSYGSQDKNLRTVSTSYGSQGEDLRTVSASYGSQGDDLGTVSTSYGSQDKDLRTVSTSYGSQGEDLRTVSTSYGSQGEDLRTVSASYGSQGDDLRTVSTSYGSQDKDLRTVSTSYGSQGEDLRTVSTSYRSQGEDLRTVSTSYGSQGEDLRAVSTSYGSQGGYLRTVSTSYGSEGGDLRTVSTSYGSQGEDLRTVSASYDFQGKDLRTINTSYGSQSEDPSSMITICDHKTGDRHDPHVHNHNSGNKLADVFFFHDVLRPGSVITPTIPVTATLPSLLPRREADSLPFSSARLGDILAMFAPASLTMEDEIRTTLDSCEHPRPLPGEKAGCATSLESLARLPAALLGTRDVRAFSGDMPVDPAGTTARRGRYNVTAVRKLSESPVAATCHDLTYPYAVFYCHTTNQVAAYQVTLAAEDGRAPAMEALAVCHLDTSQWTPRQPFLVAHNLKPGDVAVCHFLSKLSIIWVPAGEQGGAREAW